MDGRTWRRRFAFDAQTIASINAVPILGAWDWLGLVEIEMLIRDVSNHLCTAVRALPQSPLCVHPMKTHKVRDVELWDGIVIQYCGAKVGFLTWFEVAGSGAAACLCMAPAGLRRGNIETCITTSSKRLSCSAVTHDGKTRLLCFALMFAML